VHCGVWLGIALWHPDVVGFGWGLSQVPGLQCSEGIGAFYSCVSCEQASGETLTQSQELAACAVHRVGLLCARVGAAALHKQLCNV
jgi:hypothetical protein